MSSEMQERAGVNAWFNGGADMQPVVVSQAVFENEVGQRLRMQVSGPEQQVMAYLESLSFAFRVEPLPDIAEMEKEIARL